MAQQDGRLLHGALASYAMAAWIDGIGTAYCEGAHTCHEVNPILRPIVRRQGVVPAMIVKGGLHVAIASLLIRAHHDSPRRVFWLTVAFASAQTAVDMANYRTLHRP